MFDRCISVALEGLGEGDESLFSSALNNARYVSTSALLESILTN